MLLYIRLHVLFLSRADTVLLAEYFIVVFSLLCDYNKIFQTNMILICVTRMFYTFLKESVTNEMNRMRDILFSCSINFMCVSETFIQNNSVTTLHYDHVNFLSCVVSFARPCVFKKLCGWETHFFTLGEIKTKFHENTF